MEITIPIGQILSFDWLNWRNVLVVNVLYGVIAHYRGLYYAKNWNKNPELRSKIKEQYSRHTNNSGQMEIDFRDIDKIDILKAFVMYIALGLSIRVIYAAVRTAWNVALRPLSYVACSLVCMSLPKLPACQSWRKTLISDCWLGDDQNRLYLPCLYQFLLERNEKGSI